MSLLRKRLRAEPALIPALGPVPGNQHTCVTWPNSTAHSASCPAGRQRMGRGDESALWGMGSGGGLSWTSMEKHIIASLASYSRKLIFSAKLPVTSWHIIKDKWQYLSSTLWIQNVATHKTATSWRAHPLDLLLQLFLPFCLSNGKVMLKSIYFLMPPPLSRSAQLMQGFLKQVESMWWIKCEHSGNSAPTRLQSLALESVCDTGYKQLYTPSVLCRGVFLYLLTKLSIFKEKWRNKRNVPFLL